MKARKFELFMGCLGNGITVCNMAVMEHGDYKHVCHIDTCGKINWYVSEDYTPADVKEKILKCATDCKEKFKAQIDRMSMAERYSHVMNRLPLADMLALSRLNEPMENKVAYGLKVLYDL